jgi:hypothetical protein
MRAMCEPAGVDSSDGLWGRCSFMLSIHLSTLTPPPGAVGPEGSLVVCPPSRPLPALPSRSNPVLRCGMDPRFVLVHTGRFSIISTVGTASQAPASSEGGKKGAAQGQKSVKGGKANAGAAKSSAGECKLHSLSRVPCIRSKGLPLGAEPPAEGAPKQSFARRDFLRGVEHRAQELWQEKNAYSTQVQPTRQVPTGVQS